MKKNLGTLEGVELREIWPTEDKDFTPWLAHESNLELLAEVIGMNLDLEAQEKNVGPFRADILCKNIYDDSWVLIENQIERTDHKHLGQVLTYAAGLGTVTIVWISSKFTEEHRTTLDWLNKITDDNFRFFGIEVELWKINESLPAPKFNIVSKPNNWSKLINQDAKQTTTETKKLQYCYWQRFLHYLQEEDSDLAKKTGTPQQTNWLIFRVILPKKYFHIATILNTVENRIGVELYISGDNHTNIFKLWEENKTDIEQKIGATLEWRNGEKASKIIQFKDSIPTNEKDWIKQHEWLKERIEVFEQVFKDRVSNLDLKLLNPDKKVD